MYSVQFMYNFTIMLKIEAQGRKEIEFIGKYTLLCKKTECVSQIFDQII